jgi:SAM-dependent methyltransferase
MGRHARIAQLARLDEPGLDVADLGCGSGRTVRQLLAYEPAVVHAIDQVSDLDDDLLHDPRVRSRIVDLDADLVLPTATLDRVVSLNTVEHLQDPVAHLVEVHRVLRPGGVLVLAHSDWDTALFTSNDDELTRRLVDRFVATVPTWVDRADGFMGRKLPALADASAQRGAPFEVVHLDSWADPHRRFDERSIAFKVAMGIVAAAADDDELGPPAAQWLADLSTLADADQFLFTVTDVAVVLRRR